MRCCTPRQQAAQPEAATRGGANTVGRGSDVIIEGITWGVTISLDEFIPKQS